MMKGLCALWRNSTLKITIIIIIKTKMCRYRLIDSFSLEHIGRLARMLVLDTEVDGSNPGSSMLFP